MSVIVYPGSILTGFAAPTNPLDLTIKGYVDSIAQSLVVKDISRLATFSALSANAYNNGSSGVGATLTGSVSGALVIDGVTPSVNDRIIVKNEATLSHNGIYTVTTVGTLSTVYVLTRATDNDESADIDRSYSFVKEGTNNAGSSWLVTSLGPYVIGTTSIIWTQFFASIYTFSTGLAQTGAVISLKPASSGEIGGIKSSSAVTHHFVTSINTDGTISTAQPAASDITGLATSATTDTTNASNITTGTLSASVLPAFTGDVVTSAGNTVTTLKNIPTTTILAGSLSAINIAAPSTPASGKTLIYIDSTSKNISSKNDAGTINHGIQSSSAVTHQFITGIADNGTVTRAQPAASDITGLATVATTGDYNSLINKPSGAGFTSRIVNGDDTVQTTDDVILQTSSGGTETMLDAASNPNKRFYFKANGSSWTLDATGLGQFYGNSGLMDTIILSDGNSIEIQSINSVWQILARGG